MKPCIRYLADRSRWRQGSVSLAALVALVVLFFVAIALIDVSTGVLISGRNTSRRRALRALADAGAEYGYWRYMYQSASLPYTESGHGLGPGSFSVTLSDDSAAVAGTFKVVSTARIGPDSYAITRVFSSSSGALLINNPNGFSNLNGFSINGNAQQAGTALRLTDGGGNEASSVWYNTKVNVTSFTASFTFRLTNANADGFTFCLHNDPSGTSALGYTGGGLGYGPDFAWRTGVASIANSVAVKFDLYDNEGEGTNSTGIYTNGMPPTTPSTDLTGTGIDLHGGNTMKATFTYSGSILTVRITDTVTHASATQTYTIDIPNTVGGATAYVGFTGGTGALTAVQDILSWTYTH